MGQQVVKMVGLALVVIFGSAMDIAAIQQDTPKARACIWRCSAAAVAAPPCPAAACQRTRCGCMHTTQPACPPLPAAEDRLQSRAGDCGCVQHGHWGGGRRLHGLIHLLPGKACIPSSVCSVLAATGTAAAWQPCCLVPPRLPTTALPAVPRPALPCPAHSAPLPPLLQTIFTMRAGVYSRWNGVVVAVAEAAMFALPFPGAGWLTRAWLAQCWAAGPRLASAAGR